MILPPNWRSRCPIPSSLWGGSCCYCIKLVAGTAAASVAAAAAASLLDMVDVLSSFTNPSFRSSFTARTSIPRTEFCAPEARKIRVPCLAVPTVRTNALYVVCDSGSNIFSSTQTTFPCRLCLARVASDQLHFADCVAC